MPHRRRSFKPYQPGNLDRTAWNGRLIYHFQDGVAIPQYSYPEMVSQAVHVGDCELLEFYMDVLDGANAR